EAFVPGNRVTDAESPSQSNHLRSTAWRSHQLVRWPSSAQRALYRNRRLRIGWHIDNHRFLSRLQIRWRAADDAAHHGSLMDVDSGWDVPRRLRIGHGSSERHLRAVRYLHRSFDSHFRDRLHSRLQWLLSLLP